MPAHYDTYDYPGYWGARDYEHRSETYAISSFLDSIPKIHTLLDIGSGFGRLVSTYLYRAKKVILTDPSLKLLNLSKKNIASKKVHFIQSRAENILNKLKRNSVDTIICVRVLHHIPEVDTVLDVAHKLLKNRGYFIMEFANKRHLKAVLQEFFKGNFTFVLDIFPKDIRSKKSIKKKTIPFVNYHPDDMLAKLEKYGFKIKEIRSVSNIRNQFLKKHISTNTLLSIEKFLQKPLARFFVGPSIFVLAQKRDK